MEPKSMSIKPKKESYRIEPAKLNTWLFMVASCMLFAAFISAYIVHKPDAQAKQLWTVFELPVYFLISTIIVTISSVTVYLAFKTAKHDELEKNKTWLGLTILLGLGFFVSQFLGWRQMVSMNLTFSNPKQEDISASYVWVITVFHALHVLGGIVLLAVTLARSFAFKVHKKQMTLMAVTHTYWHFVGLLWIYLYLFLYFAR